MNQPEPILHQTVCMYIRMQYPTVIFNSDMSGVKLTKGQAIKAKKLRSSRGFPDLMILEPRGQFHGCFIELKARNTRLKNRNGDWATDHIAEQADMIEALTDRGYFALFAVGFDEARKIVDWYLHL